MKLIIYVNENFEEEKALVDVVHNKVLLHGDYYHDKVDERIEGYLKALVDNGIYEADENEIEKIYIDETDERYNLVGFQG